MEDDNALHEVPFSSFQNHPKAESLEQDDAHGRQGKRACYGDRL